MIEKFCKYFEGYFNNQKQAFSNPSSFALIELEHFQLSSNKFRIIQKYNIDPTPYRKNIIEIFEENDHLLIKNYKDNEELTYLSGCDIIMEYKDNKFFGKNTCKDCIVNWQEKSTYLITESILTENLYEVVDRGFDTTTDEQIWGSFFGSFQFNKIKSLIEE
jgi:CpeT protein